MKCLSILITLIALSFTYAAAQIDPSTVTIKTIKVVEDVYMLEGRGGNIMIAVYKDDILMVDSQFAPLSDKIKESITTISDKPIKYLVNTHHHGDHTGGNENFNNDNTTVIAQSNVLRRLQEDNKPIGYLPEITLDKKLNLQLEESNEAMIIHVHEAHTDGDSFVYLVDKNVAHLGDVFFNGAYPFIDLNSGGSINGYITAQQLILDTINEDTILIPGHGKIATIDDLRDHLNMLLHLRSTISLQMSKKQSKEQIVADAGTTAYYDKLGYGDGFISSERIKATIYESLKTSITD